MSILYRDLCAQVSPFNDCVALALEIEHETGVGVTLQPEDALSILRAFPELANVKQEENAPGPDRELWRHIYYDYAALAYALTRRFIDYAQAEFPDALSPRLDLPRLAIPFLAEFGMVHTNHKRTLATDATGADVPAVVAKARDCLEHFRPNKEKVSQTFWDFLRDDDDRDYFELFRPTTEKKDEAKKEKTRDTRKKVYFDPEDGGLYFERGVKVRDHQNDHLVFQMDTTYNHYYFFLLEITEVGSYHVRPMFPRQYCFHRHEGLDVKVDSMYSYFLRLQLGYLFDVHIENKQSFIGASKYLRRRPQKALYTRAAPKDELLCPTKKTGKSGLVKHTILPKDKPNHDELEEDTGSISLEDFMR